MVSPSKRFLVIGLGPSGGVLAALLSAHGCRVSGVDSNDTNRAAIQEKGIEVSGLQSLKARLHETAARIQDLKDQDFDYAFIAVKTPCLDQVCADLKTLQGSFKVVAYQNGIDNEKYLAEVFDPGRVMRVAINHAGILESPGKVKMTFFVKPNYVGCMCGHGPCSEALELAGIMTNAGLETEATADIGLHTWQKTILNASLSGVCAVTGANIKDVMESSQTHPLVVITLKECIEVAKAAGYDFGENFLDNCLTYLRKAGSHKPSMQQDIERGRHTEIKFINGKIVEYGEKLNIAVPVNTTITALVTAIEEIHDKESKDARQVLA